MRKQLCSSAMALAAVGFIACGDEITNNNIIETTGMQMVEAGEKIPDCTDESKGELIYVLDSAAAFFCADGEWQSWKGEKGDKGDKGDKGSKGEDGSNGTNGKNGSSCTTKQVKDGIQVSCPGSDPVVIKNGEKGGPGTNGAAGESCTAKENKADDGYDIECGGKKVGFIKNGTNGAAGESCTAKENKADDGYDIECGGKKVGFIKNGTDGEAGESCSTKAVENGIEVSCPGSEPVTIANGTNGKNGTSCSIDSDKDGVVVIKCGEDENAVTTTLYKAMCGTEPYDPAEKFCVENKPYDLCGGESYDPVAYECVEGELVTKCGPVEYNTQEKLCDTRDNQLYKIVTIAPEGSDYSETWMAENLNYEMAEGSFCAGDNATEQTAFCAKYGRLYKWAAAVGKSESDCGYGKNCTTLGSGDVQGVCPEGWHLPSQAEFSALINAVGGSSAAGYALKSADGWADDEHTVRNDDTYFFAALPAGLYSGGSFYNEGYNAYFWSSTQDNGDNAYVMDLYNYRHDASLSDKYKGSGYSVRCIKNK